MDYAMNVLGIAKNQQNQELLESHASFEALVKMMRAQLGQDKVYLDRYIITFLRMLDNNNALYAGDYATHTIASGLRRLLKEYKQNPSTPSSHPFFAEMIRCMEENPCPDDRYYVEYYFVKLAVGYTLYALRMFEEACAERLAKRQGADALHLAEKALGAVLSSSSLSALNTVLISRFVMAPYVQILLQTMADEVASAYLYYPLEDMGDVDDKPPDDDTPLLYTLMFDALDS